MRKSELLKLNNTLFEKLEKYKLLYEDLKKENESLKELNKSLTEENNVLKEKQVQSKPLESLNEKLKKQAVLSEEAKYGAAAIGKIVVKAATLCNYLTSAKDGYDPKELVNLILGRTEVAKSEILKAVEADMTFDNKSRLIDDCKKSAEDYFLSVMAQKD